MSRIKSLRKAWNVCLLLFLIFSIAYIEYSGKVLLSPGYNFAFDIGRVLFMIFIAVLLIILVTITIVLYFLSKDHM